MAFQDSLENSRTVIKLNFQRVESYKVAKRLTRNENGHILRKKSDLFKVNCPVIGSSYGTDSDLKFTLKPYFENQIFKSVEELVKVGRDFEGYTPVF